ncbi:MAG TPA: hypothetical protein VFF06_24410 [Polyangia bacterium]|nr:hypothetical protein [Polyangia bacterium]
MTLPTLLACLALVASLVMLAQHRPIAFPVAALVVAGFEVASAFGLVHFSLGRVPLGLVLGVALVIAGAAVYMSTAAKSVVAAATTVALVGAIQALGALHIH